MSDGGGRKSDIEILENIATMGSNNRASKRLRGAVSLLNR